MHRALATPRKTIDNRRAIIASEKSGVKRPAKVGNIVANPKPIPEFPLSARVARIGR